MTEQLIVKKDQGVGYLGLNQPEKHNAISYDMWQGIAEAMDDFEGDDRVRVIVVSGEGGRAFSAGADISQFEERRGSKEATEVYNKAIGQASQKLATIPKPTLARIEGYCIGGGLAVALCCDLRIASDDSQFGIPAARLGLGYGFGGICSLVNLVGAGRAKEILFTAKRFPASEAYDMGLVNRVLNRDEMDDFVNDYAETIAGNAPLTIKACKQVIAEIGKEPDDRDLDFCKQLVEDCFASEDYQEGRKAFMEKRKPVFRGK
jgi:enoyl-CoA hydratase/carnithine racemase